MDKYGQVLTGLDKYFMHIICIHMYMLNCLFYLLDKAQELQQLGQYF